MVIILALPISSYRTVSCYDVDLSRTPACALNRLSFFYQSTFFCFFPQDGLSLLPKRSWWISMDVSSIGVLDNTCMRFLFLYREKEKEKKAIICTPQADQKQK